MKTKKPKTDFAKTSETKRTCNQCHKNMEYSAEVEVYGKQFLIPVCTRPGCPNFGLLQISVEQMPKESK